MTRMKSFLSTMTYFTDLDVSLENIPVIDKEAHSVAMPCRKVPFALQDALKKRTRKNGNATCNRASGETHWVHSVVIVDKKNGKLRVCLDPWNLNKVIKRKYDNLPSRDQVIAQFAATKYFTKFDAWSVFWEMKLERESSKLCTFITPFGRYKFLRLPFGISSAPEVYHRTIHQIFENMPGVDTSMDDIIIWGSTKAEHEFW